MQATLLDSGRRIPPVDDDPAAQVDSRRFLNGAADHRRWHAGPMRTTTFTCCARTLSPKLLTGEMTNPTMRTMPKALFQVRFMLTPLM